MAIYRQVHVDFWQDAFVLDLNSQEKYFYLYLMTNSKTSQCGIYELSMRIIEMDTGYDRETIENLLKKFQEYGKILYCKETKEVMLLNWLKFNFVNSPKVKSCMTKELAEVKNKEFLKKLIDIVKQQKLTEDISWIPYSTDEGNFNATSQETPLDTISKSQEYPTHTLSIPSETPENTISIDYGEEREEEKHIEREIKEEEKQKEIKEEKDIKQQLQQEVERGSVALLKHFESLTGHVGKLNLNSVKTAVKIHGYDNVKMAIEKALEANKPAMSYINGILKNWAKDGYPKDLEGIKHGNRINFRENNTGKFSGFKPEDPKRLTAKEQIQIEGELI